MALLGVNIDHVATIREARKTTEPSPLYAAFLAEIAGCHSITVHPREDERHIKQADVIALHNNLQTRLNMEMALTSKLLSLATELKPYSVCLVPEKRQEITTESGFSARSHMKQLQKYVPRLLKAVTHVSLFIDPNKDEIQASKDCGATMIELHTGPYAAAKTAAEQQKRLVEIQTAVKYATDLGLIVNAGHGLTYFNIRPLARLPGIHEFNIGHSIISRAVFVGMEKAVKDMLNLL